MSTGSAELVKGTGWNRFRPWLPLTFIVLLISCSNQPQIQDNQDWRARGKFSYSDQDSRETGSFNWRQQDDQYLLTLSGPLGFGSARIEGNLNQVAVRLGNQPVQTSDNPSLLLKTMTGLALPLESLPYWLRGMPADPATEVTRTKDHSWQFTENSWQVIAEKRQKPSAEASGGKGQQDPALPDKLILETAGNGTPGNPSRRLKLVIKDWQARTF